MSYSITEQTRLAREMVIQPDQINTAETLM